jgi:phosphoglycerate dehydrogenase-like enzyme
VTTALIFHRVEDRHLQQLRSSCPQATVVACQNQECLNRHLPETEVLISFKCDQAMLDRAPNLKWFQALTTGVDFLPRKSLAERGIILTSTRGIHAGHMTEYAIAALIMLARNMHRMIRNQPAHTWQSLPQGEIKAKVLAIVGLGSIGREIAAKAALMGMEVHGVRKHPEPAPDVKSVVGLDRLDQVLARSDYVINLLPLTPETEEIFDRDRFSRMKQGACFINMGRGGSVNEEDLVEALKSNHLGGFAGDVFKREPLPPDHPLWDLETAMITPHICGESTAYMDKALPVIESNLQAFAAGRTGEMVNRIDPHQPY